MFSQRKTAKRLFSLSKKKKKKLFSEGFPTSKTSDHDNQTKIKPKIRRKHNKNETADEARDEEPESA